MILRAVDAPKPWGWELWLTSTRPEAPARLDASPETPPTLAELVASQPEVIGEWSRRLFGDAMPMFAKLIHTNFPRRVHLGFRTAVEPETFHGWLAQEQEALRKLSAALRISTAQAFTAFDAHYSAWSSQQALAGWRRDDDDASASAFTAFVDPTFDLRSWLRLVRHNRAAIADSLNEIDLARHSGKLFLSSAGVVHAIFGLSLQTHPRDPARSTLERIFGELAERAATGYSDTDLARIIEHSGLSLLRRSAIAPAKNEAWYPTVVEGADVLVEPQQTSDTTYSLADFYTPLVWSSGRVAFRKGSPEHGLSHDDLAARLAEVDFAATAIESICREPVPVAGAWGDGAALSRLVDEATVWPFFTAYQLELRGRFAARPPAGVFQQLVVIRGRVELADEVGVVGELSPRNPGFIPATLRGGYTLSAREASTVMIFAVPGARGGAPREPPARAGA